MMALFHLDVLRSQQTKHEGPDAETLKWNGVIIMIHAFQLSYKMSVMTKVWHKD